MDKLIKQINLLYRQLMAKANKQTPASLSVLAEAKRCLGQDASPLDKAPDGLSCAESVTTVMNNIDKRIPVILGTSSLHAYLSNSQFFIPVEKPLPGDIINFPTGMGNGSIANGHAGIVGEKDEVLSSNPRRNGIFDNNWTISTLTEYLGVKGGYPRFFFRKIL